LNWTRLLLSKGFPIRQRDKFIFLWDCNNPSKHPQFANPSSSFNPQNRSSFGTFSRTRGGFSEIGAGRMHHIILVRSEF
jgi:hypothetical protein